MYIIIRIKSLDEIMKCEAKTVGIEINGLSKGFVCFPQTLIFKSLYLCNLMS